MERLVITRKSINEFNTINPLLDSLYNEVKSFASKKQDGTLSELKVKAINKILARAKDIVKNRHGVEFLELLDTDTLPSNSDAVIIIVQYQSLLLRYLQEHSVPDPFDNEGYIWNLDKRGQSPNIEENEEDKENDLNSKEDEEDL